MIANFYHLTKARISKRVSMTDLMKLALWLIVLSVSANVIALVMLSVLQSTKF